MSDFLKYFNMKLTKPFVIIGGFSLAGFSAFAIYSYFRYKRRMVDEGFVDQNVDFETLKNVYVLGLEGAGKSTFLKHIAKLEGSDYRPDDYNEFNVLSALFGPKTTVIFWEIRGAKKYRVYWSSLLHDIDLLIYMVDSADEHKLAESVKELHILLASEEKWKKVPIRILANKQDLRNAISPTDIALAFEVPELAKSHEIAVYSLEMPENAEGCNKSVFNVKEKIMVIPEIPGNQLPLQIILAITASALAYKVLRGKVF